MLHGKIPCHKILSSFYGSGYDACFRHRVERLRNIGRRDARSEIKNYRPDVMTGIPRNVDTQCNQYPVIGTLGYAINFILVAHIIFVISWMVIGSISPPLAEMLVIPIHPLSNLMIAFFPAMNGVYAGKLSLAFYNAVITETTVVMLLMTCLWIVRHFAKYWSRPWRQVEFFLDRGGFRFFSIQTCIACFALLSLFILITFVSSIWFDYLLSAEPRQHPRIQLHQLGLWSILASSAPLLLVIIIAISVSAFAYVIRRVVRLLY